MTTEETLVSTKEVDYLDEDKPIRSQNYCCLSFLSPESVKVNVQAVNKQHIQKIDNRDVTFGVKEEMEEILVNKGYSLDDSLGYTIQVNIDSIYSPQKLETLIRPLFPLDAAKVSDAVWPRKSLEARYVRQ
mgnify:CR=1 FL=1